MAEAQTYLPKKFSSELIDRVGSIGKVLSEFLDSEQQEIQKALKEKFPEANDEAVKLILNTFVTADGTKHPLKLEEIKLQEVSKEPLIFCIQRLEHARILRLEDDTYELAHDTLAAHIHGQRSASEIGLLEAAGVVKNRWKDYEKTETLMNAKEVYLVSDYIDMLKKRALLSTEELEFVRLSIADVRRRRLARRITVAAIMLILAIASSVSIFSAVKATKEKQRADLKAREAERNLADAIKAGFEADQAKFRDLIGQGMKQMESTPPEYGAALDFFTEAKHIADIPRHDSLRLNKVVEGKDVEEYLQFAKDRIDLKPQFDSLMRIGKETEAQGFEHYVDALGHYRSALALDYDNQTAQVNIDIITKNMPTAFKELRQDGDNYFYAGKFDRRGYADAHERYNQANRIAQFLPQDIPQEARDSVRTLMRRSKKLMANE